MNLRTRVAHRLNPIIVPEILTLNDFRLDEGLPRPVNFSPLESPLADNVALLKFPSSYSIKLMLPSTVENLPEFLDDLPANLEIETLFERLARPPISGKAYRQEIESPNDPLKLPPIDVKTRCRHGEIQAYCQICHLERATRINAKKDREFPKVDVFEQLWYVLQPPILKPQGQPTIFPNGNRPYEFQIAGIKWLTEHKEGLLADEMGLGKTVQAIIASRILFRNGTLQKALVVCPASLTMVWERELKSWAPDLRPLRIYGSREARAVGWRTHGEVYIVSYETLARDIGDFPSDMFDLCILDEIQKVKNPTTDLHKGVKQLTSNWRWGLSGTPMENSSQDVASIFAFIVPGLLSITNPESPSVIKKKIRPYTLRRTVEEAQVDLPDLIHQVHWLSLTESQRIRYEEEEEEGKTEIEDLGENATRINVLALVSKLKQICNYDDESEESCKLDFLMDELEEIIENNEKALVFSQYPIKTLQVIAPKLEAFNPVTFDGSNTTRERDSIVQDFQNSDEHSILLMSIRAGGTGLTLTRANHVFHYDHWWNPAVVDQGTARIRRIGQTKTVFAHSIYTSDTVEERIAQIIENKRGLFRQMFEDFGGEINEEAISRFSDEDLFGLFGLKPPKKENKTRSKFFEMTPDEFEQSIGTIFENLGYVLAVTQKTRDGGIDLDGYELGLGGGRVIVQCKRYSGTVGIAAVRDLFGVVSSDNRITKGFLVTTGNFSSESRSFVKDKRITLIDGTELEARFSNL